MGIYIIDDQLEKQWRKDVKIACAGLSRTDGQSRKRFPNLPTIKEMK